MLVRVWLLSFDVCSIESCLVVDIKSYYVVLCMINGVYWFGGVEFYDFGRFVELWLEFCFTAYCDSVCELIDEIEEVW